MTVGVYNTDSGWIESLRRHPPGGEINFWRTDTRIVHLPVGSYFYFKLRGLPFIAGRAVFRGQANMTIPGAWGRFGTANGASSLEEFEKRAKAVLGVAGGDFINCLILDNLELLLPTMYLRTSREQFAGDIQGAKYFDDGVLDDQWHAAQTLEQDPAGSVTADIATLVNDLTIHETERAALIAARVGQGAFRRNVLAINSCAVTSCSTTAALRASHIKPWYISTNLERLNPHNGLPLVASLDALFDLHLISFRDDGQMLVSPTIGSGDCETLHLRGGLIQQPTGQMRDFLAAHRRRYKELVRIR